jgi:hypothetical protein
LKDVLKKFCAHMHDLHDDVLQSTLTLLVPTPVLLPPPPLTLTPHLDILDRIAVVIIARISELYSASLPAQSLWRAEQLDRPECRGRHYSTLGTPCCGDLRIGLEGILCRLTLKSLVKRG